MTGRVSSPFLSRRVALAGALCGLLLSGLLVGGLVYAAARLAGAAYKAEMRALNAELPRFEQATPLRAEENWDNLYLFWQGESVLPRIVTYYRSDRPLGEVATFYRERLMAAGWQAYREPWSLYPAYRRGKYRLAILFQQPYAQDWVPAGEYQVHLWASPVLEALLGRDVGAANDLPSR
mgnify:CR=1 FL=1